MNNSEAYIIEQYESIIEDKGYTFVDVEYHYSNKNARLTLFIERLDGAPVNIDDCEFVSRFLEPYFDEDTTGFLQKKYNLEVSSPGIERPLKRPKDFKRFKGSFVVVKTYQAVDKQKKFIGKLIDSNEDGFDLKFDDGHTMHFSYDQVSKTHLYIEF